MCVKGHVRLDPLNSSPKYLAILPKIKQGEILKGCLNIGINDNDFKGSPLNHRGTNEKNLML